MNAFLFAVRGGAQTPKAVLFEVVQVAADKAVAADRYNNRARRICDLVQRANRLGTQHYEG